MFSIIRRRRLVLQIPGDGRITNLLLPVPIANSQFSTAVAIGPTSEPCRTTTSYLISCGLSPAAAAALAATTSKLRIRSTDKADAVCALLRQYGFTDASIVQIVRNTPRILLVDPERIIRPKLDFFVSLGYEPRRLVTVPFFLSRSLDKHLVPCIQFLRSIMGTDENIRAGISRFPRALQLDLHKNMRPAVEALRLGGLTDESISRLIVIRMCVLMVTPDRINEIFDDLKAIGISIQDSRFIYCFGVMCGVRKETLVRKQTLYKSFGLSENEVINAFKKQPTILHFSDENIKKKVRFFLVELKIRIRDLICRPVIIGYSLEKTILPRCAVLSVLMREGKIQRDVKLPQALLGSSRTFYDRFVKRYANDMPDVVKAYEGKIKFEGFSCATQNAALVE